MRRTANAPTRTCSGGTYCRPSKAFRFASSHAGQGYLWRTARGSGGATRSRTPGGGRGWRGDRSMI